MSSYLTINSITPILAKLGARYDILYNANLTAKWTSSAPPSTIFPITLSQSCIGYDRLVVEFITNDANFITVDVLNPIADMKFCAYDVVHTSSTSYYKQVGCKISSDGTQLQQVDYVGEVAFNTSSMSHSQWKSWQVNKVIGIKGSESLTNNSTKFLNAIGLKQIWDWIKEKLSYKVLFQNDYYDDYGGASFTRTRDLSENVSNFKRIDIEAISDDEEHFFVSVIDPVANKTFSIIKITYNATGQDFWMGTASLKISNTGTQILGGEWASKALYITNTASALSDSSEILRLQITKVIGRYTY